MNFLREKFFRVFDVCKVCVCVYLDAGDFCRCTHVCDWESPWPCILQIGSCGSPPSFTHPSVSPKLQQVGCSHTTNILTHAIPCLSFASSWVSKKEGNERGDLQLTIWPKQTRLLPVGHHSPLPTPPPPPPMDGWAGQSRQEEGASRGENTSRKECVCVPIWVSARFHSPKSLRRLLLLHPSHPSTYVVGSI